jgi:hypothetical protein
LPIPGTPTSVTSCAVSSLRQRANASVSRKSSRSRPTSAVRCVSSTSVPKRERAATTSQTEIGFAFPFAWTGSAAR